MSKRLKGLGFTLIYCGVIAMMVRPAYLETLPLFSRVYSLGFWAAAAVSALMLCVELLYKRSRIKKMAAWIFGFYALLILVAVVKGSTLAVSELRTPIGILSMTALLTLGFKRHYREMMLALEVLLCSYTLINFATIILFPNALYSTAAYTNANWFLGYKNVMIRTILPALVVCAIQCVRRHGRLTLMYGALYAANVTAMLLTDCKTGLMGLVVFGALLFIFREGKMPAFVNLKSISLLIVGLSFLMAAFDVVGALSGLVSDMGEAGSLGSRVTIWTRSMELIGRQPVFGYGYLSSDKMRTLLNTSTGWTMFTHPHNYVMYLLLQGGAVGLIVMGLIYSRVGKRCLSCREDFAGKAILAMYVAFLTMGLMESLVGAMLLYPMMTLTDTFREHPLIYRKADRVLRSLRRR